jgi:hypothetical protein
MRALQLFEKTTRFWQAFLRVGLPMTVMYRGTDYLIFSMGRDHLREQYMAWYVFLAIDAATAGIISAMWAGVMRSVFRKPD